MLAYYDVAPTEIYVSIDQMQSYVDENELPFKQFRTARVIDPEGNVVCYYDFSERNEAHSVVLKVPPYEGEPGVWTVSYVGGKGTCDEVTIGIPETAYWGMRGDMFLGFNAKTQTKGDVADRTWYIYVPESSVGAEAVVLVPSNKPNLMPTIKKADETVLEEVYKNNNPSTYADIGSYLHAHALSTQINEADGDTVWTMDFGNWSELRSSSNYWPDSANFAFNGIYVAFANGLPGLVCPTEAAARKLKGGIQTSADGRVLGGSVQARARDAGVDIAKNGELTVDVTFADELSAELEAYGRMDVEALITGTYGGLSGVAAACAQQNVDPEDIYLGSLGYTEFEARGSLAHMDSFENFVHSSTHRDITPATAFASIAGTPTKLNAAYGNEALVNRAALAALTHYVEMSPESLLRGYGLSYKVERDENGDLVSKSTYGDYWPCEKILFTYANLAVSYNLLKDKVTPEVCDIMRDGLIQIGDKLANYQANDTNQWTEMLKGHLETYLATGEERFLRYFERAVVALGKPPVDSNSLGQSAAGFFLERQAPSANYANLAMHNIWPCYYSYRALKNKDPEVFAAFHDCVSREVGFESLHWLPTSPGGNSSSPTAHMVKGQYGSYTVGGGYPNLALAAVGFPLAATFLSSVEELGSTPSIGPDTAYNRPEVAKQLLEEQIFGQENPLGVSATPTSSHASRTYEIFTQEQRTTEKATLPVYETDRVWDLDGLYVWKKNGIYAMNIYANPYSVNSRGVSGSSLAHRGGLPFAVWSEGTGPVVLAKNVNDGTVSFDDAKGATTYYSGVFVTDAGGTTHTTKHSNGVLTEQTDEGYTITQKVGTNVESPSSAVIAGTVTYKTTYTATGFSVDVAYEPAEGYEDYTEAYITLPIASTRSGRYWGSSEDIHGTIHSVITQSEDKKTLNYKSTLENAFGSMNIHSSTAATLGETYGYTTFAGSVVQKLVIPLEDGAATVTFEVVTEN